MKAGVEALSRTGVLDGLPDTGARTKFEPLASCRRILSGFLDF